MSRLDEPGVAEALRRTPGWERAAPTSTSIRYNTVTLALTTHDAGGLSPKDFDLARTIDAA